MFKLSEFKERLRCYLDKNIILPSNYQQALHSQIDSLEDLSVSREAERIYWGISVIETVLKINSLKYLNFSLS